MELKRGYKQTEVGVIPEDWDVKKLGDVAEVDPDNLSSSTPQDYLFQYISLEDVDFGTLRNTTEMRFGNAPSRARRKVKKDDVLIATVRPNLKSHLHIENEVKDWVCSTGFSVVRSNVLNGRYIYSHLFASVIDKQIETLITGSNYPAINSTDVRNLQLPLPPTKAEQEAIAEAISDADELITALERLITKKRNIKQGAMQQLLTGRKRLPGFSGKWKVKTLEELTDCLDNLRVPLNETERLNMQGDYPYCGANGILDYIDKYMIDDDIILIAEDGGYFDEYLHRPIAYRMKGKCWVNNHAHILKAKENFSQDFIFYSLVHKNILRFLASGTRAKLNKSEMYKIDIDIPATKSEQTAIASILSDMDTEIEALEQKRDKYKAIKQGMMQELLIGKTRLV